MPGCGTSCPPPGARRRSGAGPRPSARCGPGADYEAWYPTFGVLGAGGADVARRATAGSTCRPRSARAIEAELAPYNLGRLNPLGLNLAAPALFAHGTDEQRLRFLPPIVRNEEVWCQLFSEPGAGSDLASLATRAERDGDELGAHRPEGVDHVGPPGRLRRAAWPAPTPTCPSAGASPTSSSTCTPPGVEVRPLRHIGGEVDFNEVFLDGRPGARRPPGRRRSATAGGWPTPPCPASGRWCRARARAASTASAAAAPGAWSRPRRSAGPTGAPVDPVVRQRIVGVYSEERIRAWTNQRVRAGLQGGAARRVPRARSARSTRATSTSASR